MIGVSDSMAVLVAYALIGVILGIGWVGLKFSWALALFLTLVFNACLGFWLFESD